MIAVFSLTSSDAITFFFFFFLSMCVLVFKYLKNAFIQNKQAIGGGSEKALLEFLSIHSTM